MSLLLRINNICIIPTVSSSSACNMTLTFILAFSCIPCQVAGVVPRGSNPGELNLDEYIPPSDQRVMSLASAYALVAADEALRDADWKPQTTLDKQRTGEIFSF